MSLSGYRWLEEYWAQCIAMAQSKVSNGFQKSYPKVICTVSLIKAFVGYTHNLCAGLSGKPYIKVVHNRKMVTHKTLLNGCMCDHVQVIHTTSEHGLLDNRL